MNIEEELRKVQELEAQLLSQPANQVMVNRIMNNIHMDLIPTFKQRVMSGFTTGEAIELEKALSLCDQLPNMSEQRKAVVTMDLDSLKMLNAQMSKQVKELNSRKL